MRQLSSDISAVEEEAAEEAEEEAAEEEGGAHLKPSCQK